MTTIWSSRFRPTQLKTNCMILVTAVALVIAATMPFIRLDLPSCILLISFLIVVIVCSVHFIRELYRLQEIEKKINSGLQRLEAELAKDQEVHINLAHDNTLSAVMYGGQWYHADNQECPLFSIDYGGSVYMYRLYLSTNTVFIVNEIVDGISYPKVFVRK